MAFSTKIIKIIFLILTMTTLQIKTLTVPRLSPEEVECLHKIVTKLNYNFWRVSQNFCLETKWNKTIKEDKILSNVVCNCAFKNGSICHVTTIKLKGLNLTGVIPSELGNFSHLVEIDLQGTSLEGPIPTTITLLKNLEQLRLTDLKGASSQFPDFKNSIKMQSLVLRNCRIIDTIPEYLGDLSKLNMLDLSFNKLTGQIPSTLGKLEELQYMFLTNNSLTGEIPTWVLESDKNKHFDLSYNNFTGSVSGSCQQMAVNLVSSHSLSSSVEIPWCMTQGLHCSGTPEFHSLFINCGGTKTKIGKNHYQEDTSNGGPAIFLPVQEQWAYSSTGVFMDKSDTLFLAKNNFNLSLTGGELYATGRLAPLSLKYYGLCLRPGSYKVQLHFAEIMFSNNHTFSSLGRRIFDVSIQGHVVLKDFNIAEKAGGVGIGMTKIFDNVTIHSGGTLEIHLYWAGKGTTAIPFRNVYGPLISGITVTPNYKVGNGGGLSVGGIIGIVAASCVVFMVISIALLLKVYIKKKADKDNELGGLDLPTGHFSLKQIKSATNNFDPANKIGEGGFGPVYRGVMPDGVVIAVKQLSSKSKQGSREFVNEVGTISALQHPNLVRLYGCCVEGKQLLLVYEYLENNSLARALFGPEDQRLRLDWKTRKNIILGIAKGLAYLHEESRLKIVHRDIKPSNVLLDNDLNAKISDFGLAKLDDEENTHISTRVAGTIGYMAPEYALRGYLTEKADVYSFGVVLLELVSGKSNNTNYRSKDDFVYLLDQAYVVQGKGNVREFVDPSLGPNYSQEEAKSMLTLGVLCTNTSPTLRPTMSSVVRMIQGEVPIRAPTISPGSTSTGQDAKLKSLEIQTSDEESFSKFHFNDISMDQGSMIGSSSSIPSKYMISHSTT